MPLKGLQAEFGEDRVFNTPLAESGIGGMAIGLALEGFRPIPEIQFLGFVFEVMDSVVAQAARTRYRLGGSRNMPTLSVHHSVVGFTRLNCTQITWKVSWLNRQVSRLLFLLVHTMLRACSCHLSVTTTQLSS